MPTVSWILLCFIIGSAAGAHGGSDVAALSAVAVVAVGAAIRRDGRLAMLAAAVAALAAGARATAARWQDGHCRAVIIRSRALEFVTDFDLATGDAAPARVRVPGNECHVDAIVRARTALRGGTWYRTSAQALPGGRSLTVQVTTAVPMDVISLRPSLRAAGVRRVDSVFLADAPIARALLLADMHLIDPAMRQRWARSGLVHLLSVSGVHVAIIAAALLMLGRAARLTERDATLLTLLVTTIYVTVLGLPPPAVRAAVMFGCLLIARLRQRPASEWSVLTLGALLPVIVDSAAPLDLGWQLSVLGVVALAASGRLASRLGWQGGAWRQSLRRELVASTVASTASAPLIAWHFGTVSLIAPAANLIAAPLVTLLQPTLFLALVCAPILPVARFVAAASHPVLALLDLIAHTGATPSWAALDLAPTLTQAMLGGVIVSAAMAAMVQHEPGRPLIAGAAGLALLSWHGALPGGGSGLLEAHFLDVGQGDATAIRTPHGQWIIIDAGGGAPGVDRGRRTVLPYIRRHGGTVAAFVLSHPHLDHVGGAPAVIGSARPALYFDGAFAGSSGAYRASLESAAVHRVRWRRVRPGDSTHIDGVTLRFLAPDSAWTSHLDDANLASTILRVEYGRAAMLFVGDAEQAEEEWVLQHTPVERLRAAVLKVGHHGSRTSSTAPFLDAIQPQVAVVSVGRGNSYGHPSPDVLAAFARRHIDVLRTDVAGTTVIRTDGATLFVGTAARHWSLPLPASAPGSRH